MEKINEGTITNINKLVDISSNSLDSKVNNIQSLVFKKKTSDYKGIYKYSVEYIQNSDNENVISIDRGTRIYDYYKEFYENYKDYNIGSFSLQVEIVEENL